MKKKFMFPLDIQLFAENDNPDNDPVDNEGG